MASATDFFDAVNAKGAGFGSNALNTTFIPQVWSKVALMTREKQLVFAEKVNRVYEKDLADFGDIVHVPGVSNLAVRTKDATATANGYTQLGGNNTAITYETLSETNTDIVINVWEYTAIAQETATKRLANRDFLKLYAGKMGYALAKSVDTVLGGYVDTANLSVGTMAVPLGYDDVLSARQQLDDLDSSEDRSIIVSPAQERGFMQLQEFMHRDYEALHGQPGKEALNKAYIGTWLGMPVYKTTNTEGTNAAGHDNVMLTKEAIALVMAINATTHTMFDIDYLANKVVVEQLYGSAVMRNSASADVYNSSGFVWMKGL